MVLTIKQSKTIREFCTTWHIATRLHWNLLLFYKVAHSYHLHDIICICFRTSNVKFRGGVMGVLLFYNNRTIYTIHIIRIHMN